MKLREALVAYDFDHSNMGVYTHVPNNMPKAPKYSPMSTVNFMHEGRPAFASIESSQSSGGEVHYNIVILNPPNVPRRSFVIPESRISGDADGKLNLIGTLDTRNLNTNSGDIINPIPQ